MFSFRETAPAKVRYRELTRARIACLCGKNHPLAQRETVTVKELRDPETGILCAGTEKRTDGQIASF